MLLLKLQADVVEAQKAHEEIKVSILRFLLSSIKNAQIAKKSELTDDEITKEIAKEVKRHNESITAFTDGGRMELADKEKTELAILQSYLPQQLAEEEIERIVNESIEEAGASAMQDMGRVMASVMAKLQGRADATMVSQLVKEKLSR